MHRFIDLSRTFDAATPVYPGDPKPQITRVNDAAKDGFTAHSVSCGLHVGTHMDAPMHMLKEGRPVSELPVETFCGAGVLIDARKAKTIEDVLLDGAGGLKGKIVLVHTGHCARWGGKDYFTAYPPIGKTFAERLVKEGARLLGLDTPSADGPPFSAHKTLLSAGIPIVENLTGLERLAGRGAFEVFAFPPKLALDGAPVRVVARLL